MKPLSVIILFLCGILSPLAADSSGILIEGIEPTPFFPKAKPGQPLRQRADLNLKNSGTPVAATVRITVGNLPAYPVELGTVATGKSGVPIFISDITTPAKVTVQVVRQDNAQVLAKRELTWQPQKKWNLYCVSYSHQDLGFGDYPLCMAN